MFIEAGCYSTDYTPSYRAHSTPTNTSKVLGSICQLYVKYNRCLDKYASHNYGEWDIEKEPTCTEEGLKRKICERCGTEQIKTIPKKHTYIKPEKAGTKYATTDIYTDGTKTANIPAGFTVSGVGGTCTICGKTTTKEYTIDGGLVVYYLKGMTDQEITAIDWDDEETVAYLRKTYDQFVWIPVNDINNNDIDDIKEMYMCQKEDGTNSCKISVQEINGEKVAYCTEHSLTDMAGRLYATSTKNSFNPTLTTQKYTAGSGLREPDILSNADNNQTNLEQLNTILGTNYASADDFKNDLQTEYNEIVKSVYNHAGFYIGRYETSGFTNGAVKIVAGSDNISKVTWYRMYAQQKKYAENNGLTGSVGSTMIQGTAYDQVMKFTGISNKKGNVGHGSFKSTPYQTGGLNYSEVYTGEIEYKDVTKNIYDLEGNIRAVTTEAFRSRTSCL